MAKRKFETLVEEIRLWRIETFPIQNLADIQSKFIEESGELVDSFHTHPGYDPSEIADCFIVLIRMCEYLGLDPTEVIREKFEIVKRRNYATQDRLSLETSPDIGRLSDDDRQITTDEQPISDDQEWVIVYKRARPNPPGWDIYYLAASDSPDVPGWHFTGSARHATRMTQATAREVVEHGVMLAGDGKGVLVREMAVEIKRLP